MRERGNHPMRMRTRIRERALPRPNLAVEVVLVTMFAALTAASAQVKFYLPFTPVPVTGQVFAVLLAGLVLGPRRGLLSQVEYLAAGAAGAPVFTHGGGLPALLGPTSGYLMAFPVAAFLSGLGAERLRARRFAGPLLGSLAGVVAIHTLGAAWYSVWALAVMKTAGLGAVLLQSVYPFLAIDVVKAGAAASVAAGLRRRLV